MRVSFLAEDPQKFEFTARITMPLSQWMRLKDQLQVATWPATDLRNAIDDIVTQAQRQFYPKEADALERDTE